MPITATRSPVEVVLVVPARPSGRALPSKESRPGSVGHDRLAERALAGDQHVGGDRPWEVSRRQRALGLVPVGALELGVEAHVLDARRSGAATSRRYVEDLGLGREGGRPVRVGREGERVEVRGDVAAAAGVGVVAPGAADVAGALEQHEVALARPASAGSPCRCPEKPGADDDDAVVGQVTPVTYSDRPRRASASRPVARTASMAVIASSRTSSASSRRARPSRSVDPSQPAAARRGRGSGPHDQRPRRSRLAARTPSLGLAASCPRHGRSAISRQALAALEPGRERPSCCTARR